MNKKSLYITLGIFLIALSFSIGYFLKPTTKTAIPNVVNPKSEPLSFFTTVDTPKGTFYIYMFQDSIYLNGAETPYYEKAPIINKDKYPKLFKQGDANSSSLRVEYYKESKNRETYLKLSNIHPNQGAYCDAYALLVDPFTGVVKESKSINYETCKANF